MGVSLNPNGLQNPDYTNTYSYNASSWTTNFQQVIPNGVLARRQVYLILIDTNSQSFGGAPYYANAAGIIYTCTGTNGVYTNVAESGKLLTSTHVATGGYWEMAVSGGFNTGSGILIRFVGGPTFSTATGTSIRVQAFKLAYGGG